MDQNTSAPVRYCHGCEQYDNHPRLTLIADAGNPAGDKLYHYDCVPADVLASQAIPADHPALVATSDGKRGDDVRAVMADYAASIPEAPADNTKRKGA